ncbi:hypothetical protein [Novosphingobium sp. 9]|uniref:hypothetical protein n=1 Tax=Novosphingobium sp. 9 TaxID=2025349 RepID=UPI0021B56038|nr:hypothetical protein [Novosphingobium sp. 9]
MLGLPLPQIIDEQISRNASKAVRTAIRNTLDLIEGDTRFQAVRLFGCYSALVVYTLDSAGLLDMVSSIPSLPLYLEIGASDKTMISFISLGLSRVTAMKLNDMSARKDLTPPVRYSGCVPGRWRRWGFPLSCSPKYALSRLSLWRTKHTTGLQAVIAQVEHNMKRINIDALQPGDIVLTASKSAAGKGIRATTLAVVSHAMICVQHGSVIDSTGDGVQARNLQRELFKPFERVYAFRLREQLTQSDSSKSSTSPDRKWVHAIRCAKPSARCSQGSARANADSSARGLSPAPTPTSACS